MRKGPPSLMGIGAVLVAISWLTEMRMKDRLTNLKTTADDVFEFFPALAPYSKELTTFGALIAVVGFLWWLWSIQFNPFRSKAMSDREDEANKTRRPRLTLDGVYFKNAYRGIDATGADVEAKNITFEDVVQPFVVRDTNKDRD